jgi:hypothetical protein
LGYVKERVFHTKVANLNELLLRITDEVASVTHEMLENTCRETDEAENQLDVSWAGNGAHKESVRAVRSNTANRLTSLAFCVLCL